VATKKQRGKFQDAQLLRSKLVPAVLPKLDAIIVDALLALSDCCSLNKKALLKSSLPWGMVRVRVVVVSGSGSGSNKKAKKPTYASWAAGAQHYKDLCNKIEDGTIDSMIATGLSLPEISKKVFPHHNLTSFNTTVKKAEAATGFLVANGMNLLFLFCSVKFIRFDI
jgi:hypothetical protein